MSFGSETTPLSLSSWLKNSTREQSRWRKREDMGISAESFAKDIWCGIKWHMLFLKNNVANENLYQNYYSACACMCAQTCTSKRTHFLEHSHLLDLEREPKTTSYKNTSSAVLQNCQVYYLLCSRQSLRFFS